METTEKIVESYVRYVKRWATIPNVKCGKQKEIDLFAIDPRTGKRSGISPAVAGRQRAGLMIEPGIGCGRPGRWGSPDRRELLRRGGRGGAGAPLRGAFMGPRAGKLRRASG